MATLSQSQGPRYNRRVAGRPPNRSSAFRQTHHNSSEQLSAASKRPRTTKGPREAQLNATEALKPDSGRPFTGSLHPTSTTRRLFTTMLRPALARSAALRNAATRQAGASATVAAATKSFSTSAQRKAEVELTIGEFVVGYGHWGGLRRALTRLYRWKEGVDRGFVANWIDPRW